MGERIDFWAFLRLSRRYAETRQYDAPGIGHPVRISVGQITSGDQPGLWFVQVNHRGLDPLICRGEDDARSSRHADAVRLMALCGRGRWSQVPPA